MKNKRLVVVLMILTIIFTLFGSTLAYWNWNTSTSERTNIVFTLTQDFSCAVDGGGPITETNAFIVPTSCTDSNHAIKRKVIVTPTLDGNNLEVSLDLWINVNSMGSELANSQNFKYALTTSDTSCTKGVVSSGSFNGATVGRKFNILTDSIYRESTTDTYYLYIWLDSVETSASTMDQKFNLSLGGECDGEVIIPGIEVYQEDVLNGAGPLLSNGMIPVNISNSGVVTTVDFTSEWYSYENKQWANAVLVSDESRSSYYQSDGVKIKANQVIPEDNILAYLVWIPKYSYKMNGVEETISIAFNDAPDGYIEHPAFEFDGEIPGFWIGKFETSHVSLSSDNFNTLLCNNENCENSDGLRVKPNVASKRRDKIAFQFYASRSIGKSGNSFGLISEKVNTHMLKNSEWGAVAYLSHSIYGINTQIRNNNNELYITGCGAMDEDGEATSDCENAFGSLSSGIYLQSTTGNISGVFDMSGGTWEYLMGYYSGANSNYASNPEQYFGYYNSGNVAGFMGSIDDKYWDNYTTNSNSTACGGGYCYGHALSETTGWYYDEFNFINNSFPWVFRGGDNLDVDLAGIFYLDRFTGEANWITWRVAIVVDS